MTFWLLRAALLDLSRMFPFLESVIAGTLFEMK